MHDLIRNQEILKSHDFNGEPPPSLHGNKGVWVPRTTIDPEVNYSTHTKKLVKTINEDSTTWEYVPAEIPTDEIIATALGALDAEKHSRLKGGFLVNGVRFDSDINAEIRYMQLATKFSSDPLYETRWKAADNVWVTMDAGLFAHVISAFELLITETYAWLKAEQEKLKGA